MEWDLDWIAAGIHTNPIPGGIGKLYWGHLIQGGLIGGLTTLFGGCLKGNRSRVHSPAQPSAKLSKLFMWW